jgi:hypothetical protein
MPSDDDIGGMLKTEVESYDTWANGEMTGYIIEVQCSKCQQWRNVDSCWGYYSVDEAMEQATHGIPDNPIHMVGAERCECEWKLPHPLSDAARAVIAGLVAPTDDVNPAGITAPDSVWDEIRAAFPLSLFEDRPDTVNYNPEAGW